MTEFETFILTFPPSEPELPLAHTTDVGSIGAITKSTPPTLNPNQCKVYNEKLLYAYYAKPVYQNDKNRSYWPIAFLFKSDKAVPKRVLPFDSGAYVNRHFKSRQTSALQIDDFHLPPSIESCRRMIGAFFGANNTAYVRSNPSFNATENVLHPPQVITCREIYRLYPSGLDDRRSITFELQFQDPIFISKTNCVAVIAPRDIRRDTFLYDKIQNSFGITPRYYTPDPHSSASMVGVIMHETEKALIDLGLINE